MYKTNDDVGVNRFFELNVLSRIGYVSKSQLSSIGFEIDKSQVGERVEPEVTIVVDKQECSIIVPRTNSRLEIAYQRKPPHNAILAGFLLETQLPSMHIGDCNNLTDNLFLHGT